MIRGVGAGAAGWMEDALPGAGALAPSPARLWEDDADALDPSTALLRAAAAGACPGLGLPKKPRSEVCFPPPVCEVGAVPYFGCASLAMVCARGARVARGIGTSAV